SGLSKRMGVVDEFTEGRDTRGWLVEMYDRFRRERAAFGTELPRFEEFWADGQVRLPGTGEEHALFEEFRRDPERSPLGTPSGRIELYSETVAEFGYEDCPGHPVWLEPEER